MTQHLAYIHPEAKLAASFRQTQAQEAQGDCHRRGGGRQGAPVFHLGSRPDERGRGLRGRWQRRRVPDWVFGQGSANGAGDVFGALDFIRRQRADVIDFV